jgi:hypothetical protein
MSAGNPSSPASSGSQLRPQRWDARRARLPPAFEFGHERGHRGVQSHRELPNDLNGRHSLPAFEHRNVRPVKARLVGEGFLGETSGLPPAADEVAELLLQGCVHFLASEPHPAFSGHRQLYVRQLYSIPTSGKLPGQPSRRLPLKPGRGDEPRPLAGLKLRVLGPARSSQ